VLDAKALGGEGDRTPVSYAYVQQDPRQALSERIQREYAVMEMPRWRWMLLVLLLGGESLETSGIPVLDSERGRCFFEEIIRENIDLGRPEQVQLIFSRKMNKSTVADGRCRTRIITEGVIPSLHIYYKSTHSKQYHKAPKRRVGLRTETTVNNTYDFRHWPASVQPARTTADRL